MDKAMLLQEGTLMNKRFHTIKMSHYRKQKIVRMSGSMTVEAALVS